MRIYPEIRSRNAVMNEDGERTLLAGGFRRPAENLVPQICPHGKGGKK